MAALISGPSVAATTKRRLSVAERLVGGKWASVAALTSSSACAILATRFEKTPRHSLAVVTITAMALWIR